MQQLSAHRASSASSNSSSAGGLAMQLGVRDAAAMESPGRPRRPSAPGSQLHTYALQHATLQQQQQQTGAGDNSPRPHHFSSIAARLANNPSYQNLPLDVASLDGHTQSCDTPDSNCSAQSAGSVMLESPHQPATTRFKPRPPGGSNSGSASSTPQSSTPGIAGSVTSTASLASASSGGCGVGSAGGAASSLQPHPPPPQSARKASKPMSGGAMASLSEVGSPRVQPPLHPMGSCVSFERCTDSPVPGSGAVGINDQGGGSSCGVSFRRRTYSVAPAAADVPGGSKLGSAFMRQASLMGLNSAGPEGGSNPNSPVGIARTSSSNGGCLLGISMSRQDSGGLGDLLNGGTGYAIGGASPYASTGGGSNSAAGAAAVSAAHSATAAAAAAAMAVCRSCSQATAVGQQRQAQCLCAPRVACWRLRRRLATAAVQASITAAAALAWAA
ncbi:hypothetical protein COO60DRAFT_223627 [Scenedesmus sp. NREL 46B-D3]|nr:hypothetical protein COO60DRAFT_223627 [Scenedesmus sp. NREL 46B-D3]